MFNRTFLSFPLIFLFLFTLSGCSQRYKDLSATLKEGFFGFPDVEMNADEIAKIPYASAYMRFDDAQRIFMVLAFAEQNPLTGMPQLKWLSSDGAMVTTEQGRVVKTLNLPGKNLDNRQSQPLHWQHNKTSAVRYDWPKDKYGFTAHALLKAGKREEHKSILWSKTLTQWEERITFDDLKETQFTNHFWVDEDGYVLKSTQYTGPDMMKVEIEILKPLVRSN